MRLRSTSTPLLFDAPCALFVGVLLVWSAGCASDASKAREALARGKQLATTHDLDGAATQFGAAAQLDPKLHEAFARLARVELERAQIAQHRTPVRQPDAETPALRAASLVPRSSYYSELLGRAQLADHKVDAALASFEQAITLDPTQTARLAFTIGVLQERASKPTDALAAYDRAATADPNAVLPRIALARLLLDAERLDDAKRKLDEARVHVAAEGSEQTMFAAVDARLTTRIAARDAEQRAQQQQRFPVLGSDTNDARARLANMGILALLGSAGDTDGWATDVLRGDTIGDSFGVGGLGITGTGGSGGYGDGTIGLGSIGTIGSRIGSGGSGGGIGGLGGLHTSSPGPRISAGIPTVNGPLAGEIIRRVVRRHLNELRYCYEAELAHAPTLAGSVNLAFTISASGATEQVSATGLGNVLAEACMASRVQRWMFPTPGAGGSVRVSYPMTFAPPAPVAP